MITIDIPPNSAKITLVNNAQAFVSKLSGNTQYSDYPGARWGVSLGWFNRSNSEGRRLSVKFSALNGPIGIFKLPIPDVAQEGTALGTGKVNGANQSGNSLVTDGWDINQPLLFAAGDWIEVNQQAFKIVDDVASDGSGNATLTITPAIRRTPADNQDIVVTNPAFYLRLVPGSKTGSDLSPSGAGPLFAFSVDALEID